MVKVLATDTLLTTLAKNVNSESFPTIVEQR